MSNEKPSNRQRKVQSNLTRRTALGGLGAGVVGSAAALVSSGCKPSWTPPGEDRTGRALAKPPVPGQGRYSTHEERWFHSSCAQCHAGCGIRVRVVEGRAVRVEGNPANPVNQGGIGARGIASLQALYDPKRIAGPLVRKNGTLVKSSWKDAMALAASALRSVRTTQHPEELLILTGQERGIMHEFLARFAQAFGTPNFVDGRPSHSNVLAQAMSELGGDYEAPVYAWSEARTVLSLEAGLIEDSCQSVYLARLAAEMRRSRANRPRLIHVGATFDLAAHNADSFVPIEPGTSGALALGLCNILISELGALDALDPRTVSGLDDFVHSLRDFTLPSVEKATGIPASEIRTLAKSLWDARPTLVYVDKRSLSFSNSLQTAHAALALNTLVGGPSGSLLRFAPSPPYRPWKELQQDAVATRGLSTLRMDQAGSGPFSGARSVHETLPEAILAQPPKVAILHYTNPIHARQQPKRWEEALRKIDLVISFSPFPDETTLHVADLVLPDHTFLERWEDAATAPAIPRAVAGVRRPVVDPQLDTRSAGDILLELARELGGTVSESFPWGTFRDALNERLLGLHDIQRGSLVAQTEEEFLDRIYKDGVWAEERDAAKRASIFSFRTGYGAPTWFGDEAQYPLRLLVYRPLGYVGGGSHQPWLHTLRSRPNLLPWVLPLTVHPEDAREIDSALLDGDRIRVVSEWGSITTQIRFDRHVVRGCACMPMGGGHHRDAPKSDVGGNVMELLRPGPAPGTGANLLCATRVAIRRLGGAA